MIILALTIIAIIVGIILITIYNIKGDLWLDEWQLFIGVIVSLFFILFLIIELSVIIFKPLDYNNFKIKYETIQEMQTSSEDIRDATYTQNLITINEEIRRNREYIDNPWFGIFYNKDIANMELLNKE